MKYGTLIIMLMLTIPLFLTTLMFKFIFHIEGYTIFIFIIFEILMIISITILPKFLNKKIKQFIKKKNFR